MPAPDPPAPAVRRAVAALRTVPISDNNSNTDTQGASV
jgi:hypothetical protein